MHLLHHSGSRSLMAGVIRPGQANQNAYGSPLCSDFFQNFVELFTRRRWDDGAIFNAACTIHLLKNVIQATG